MYVPVSGVRMHTLALALSERRYGDVYFSTIPEPHLKFESESDAIAFSLQTGFKVYSNLGDKDAL